MSALPASADTRPPVLTTPITVSSDGLPTVQINGVAWQQVIVGNTVYVAGSFSTARPAGAAAGVNTVPRANLLAYDIRTGNLITTWAPSLNAQALAIAASPDGSRIYVGGDFTSVNGSTVWRIAAINATTGALITSFLPRADAKVRAIATSGSTVYFGGLFSSVGGTARGRLAAVRASDGGLLPWTPSATGGTVNALVVSPDGAKLVVGGAFTALNGSSSPGYGLGAVDATSGALMPWAVNSLIRNGGSQASILSLSSDSDSVYGSGYVFGSGGNLEGTFRADWSDGTLRWVDDCHGDTYSVYAATDVVYEASHKHYCGNIGAFPQTDPWTFHRATALTKAVTGVITADPYGYYNFEGTPSPTQLDWYPDLDTGTYTGMGQGPWSVTGNSQYIVMGGEFLHANNNYGVSQQGLVRYAVPAIAPNKQGPVLTGAKIDLTGSSLQAGTARIRWTANWDRDNTHLTYTLSRNSDTAHPVYTTTLDSTFWQRPGMGFIDKGLTPGTTYKYRLVVTDPWGNIAQSDFVTVTVAAPQASTYADEVIADQPAAFWRLGEPSGTTAVDWAGWNDALVNGTVTRGTAGAIIGDTNAATTFPGTSGTYVSTQMVQPPQDAFSLEAWINTTTTSGGKIIGFGNSPTGDSGQYDRHVYMDNSGKIWFGVYPGGVQTLTSAKSYNDGAWHHVVASLGVGGMALYVDGKRVASRTDVTIGQDYQGVWRVGGDNLNGWPSQPSSSYFAGVIDDVAIYPVVLDPTQIVNHYVASGRVVQNDPPLAAITTSMKKGVLTADGSGSTDSDGTIASYAWNFGDGATDVGVTASHTYAASGTYTVSLTVTDNGGATGTATHEVTVLAAPADLYGAAVYQSGPDLYWRLGESSGTTANDASSNSNTGTYQSGVTLGQPGAIFGTTDTAVAFDGSSGLLSSDAQIQGPSTYSEELWFNTTTTNGGKLIGFGNSPTGTSSNYDRHVYMENDGRLTFGTWTGQPNTITSPLSYNDGAWHHMVATQSSAGMMLYVDGKRVGTNPQTAAQDYAGYWRVGSDTTWGPQPYFAGTIDEVAVYNSEALTATQVADHYVASGRVLVNVPPTAAFTSTVKKGVLTADASASQDVDGTIASYAWDFGDGTSGTGVTASHTYAAAGTYTVALTVTDNGGATGTVSHGVTVLPVLPAPADVYGAAVYQSNPDLYWRLGEASGTTAADASSSGNTGTYQSGVTLGQPGGVAGTTDTAVVFDGSSGLLSSNTSIQGPSTYSEELWFNTTTTNGGKLIGFGNSPTGTSSAYDRHVYMENDGRLTFGTYTGQLNTVTSPASYNDGAWHHMVATQSSAGMMLYVDGALVGTNPQTAAQDYVGYWRVGSDTTWGPQPYFAGTIDEVAVYFTEALSPATVAQHYTLGSSGALPNQLPVAAFTSTATKLAVTVDGSSSTDPDGTIASYAWDFGDGSSATGATASHTYAAAGTYTVALTVTDNRGGTNTVAHDVTAVANQAPVAAFTSAAAKLALTVDGSGSTDGDGTIASYAWAFGDGATGTGVTASHTYAAAGTYTVTLTVTDNDGATGTVTHGIPVVANQAPVAAFTVSAADLVASVNASGSTDADGTIASYAWAFGDGATGTGVTASHTYAAAGTYTITLTVTDNDGATGTVGHGVTVTTPPVNPNLAADAFGRSVTGGWGAADTGGAWSLTGAASGFSVVSGTGLMTVARAGSGLAAYLAGVSSINTDVAVTVWSNKVANGGGEFISLLGRRTPAGDDYRAKVKVASTGAVTAYLTRVSVGVETTLTSATVSGLTYAAGDHLQMRVQVTGTSPTTVRMKVWRLGTTEPTAWRLTTTDATAALQAPGAVGLVTYLSGTATNVPVVFGFDDLLAVDPTAG